MDISKMITMSSFFLVLVLSLEWHKTVNGKCGETPLSGSSNETCSIEGVTPKLIASGREKALMKRPTERTLVIIKPDGIIRGLVGKCISRFERKMFKLLAMKFLMPSISTIQRHYADHIDTPYFPQLSAHMLNSPILLMVWEGLDVISQARKIIGTTSPTEASAGTIRGDYGTDITKNVIHSSDNAENAINEIKIWFSDDEIVSWKNMKYTWDVMDAQS